jgi:hypothetical protein
MTVDNEDTLVALDVLQDKTFTGNDAVLVHSRLSLALNIVITNDQMDPLSPIELVEQVKNALVGFADCRELPGLPQIIPIAHLNIGEPVLIVVLQSIQVETLVSGKDIGAPIVSPMTVRKKHHSRGVVKAHLLGGKQNPLKTLLCVIALVPLYRM